MKPKIVFYHRQQSAVGYYRSWVPARYLARMGYDVTWNEAVPVYEAWGRNPQERMVWSNTQLKSDFDVLWVDRAYLSDYLEAFTGIKHFSPRARMVCDLDDDFTNVPWWNVSQCNYQPGQPARETGFMHLKLAEMTTVSTDALETQFESKAHTLSVVKNAIDPVDWEGLYCDPDRASDPNLRVLYGGAQGHYGDLDVARFALEKFIREPPVPWRLIVCGSLPAWLHDLRREFPQRVIGLPWVTFKDYPQAIAWGGFDLAIAPLLEHPFNEAKSNIKWLEAGIQDIPTVCSDVGSFRDDIPPGAAIKLGQSRESWVDGLKAALEDSFLREKTLQLAKEAIRDEWTIDRRGHFWENVVEEVIGLPRIESREDAQLQPHSAPVAAVD